MVYSQRKLQYPLNRSEIIEALVIDESPLLLTVESLFPIDPDQKIDVVINLSLNEYVSLATSVDVGRDIAYGDGEIDIWWLWSRILTSTFCEKMIDCINENDEVRQAIINALNNGVPVSGESGVNESIANTDLLVGITCDNDSLFGATTGLVDLINNIATDLIEQLQASSNTTGRVGDIIEAIPGVGILPYDDLLQAVETFWDDLAINYDASYTVTLRDDYRCGLFCIAKDDCTITFQQIFDYFLSELGESVSTHDFEDFLEFITAGTFSGVELVHAFHVLVSGLMLFGASITNIDQQRMFKIFQTMFNDPDSDWLTLCDCPELWTWNSDFPTSENIWEVTNLGYDNLGTWASTTGYSTSDARVSATSWSRITRIATPEFTPTYIDDVTINYDMTKGTTDSSTQVAVAIVAIRDGGSQIIEQITFGSVTDGSGKTLNLAVNESDIKQFVVLVRCSYKTSVSYSGSCKLNSIEINGEGFNPFE